jgi:hypothetical protein|tara:strand:+ start:505 stop:654 length:150 start_codon:yes stop_codon:yes gene_type:complete
MPYSKYSAKQKGLASLAGNRKKIGADDLAKLRAMKSNAKKKRKPKNRKA